MVLPDSDKVPRASSYLGTVLAFQAFTYGTITLYGLTFQKVLLAIHVRYGPPRNPHQKNLMGLGYSAFARRYLQNLG